LISVSLVWNWNQSSLYVNGLLVASRTFIKPWSLWSSQASFSIGASGVHTQSGGSYACDDKINGSW
jgi:hypothetical protein